MTQANPPAAIPPAPGSETDVPGQFEEDDIPGDPRGRDVPVQSDKGDRPSRDVERE